jgi:diaminohydroxyphosphoribosylaminopyrimidine deaminase/5-amino-6-(5-phosphoribosylamino)uracil reductase
MAPVLVAASAAASAADVGALRQAGCEVVQFERETHPQRLEELLNHLGQRRMTNVLVEGGARILGALWDAGAVDEVHVFIAPRILGSAEAVSPIAGAGRELIAQAAGLENFRLQQSGEDVYIHGRVMK